MTVYWLRLCAPISTTDILLMKQLKEPTLRFLLSVLFYQTTWSEFLQKVSIKQPGLSQKKMILLSYFRAATANFLVSTKRSGLGILEKVSIKQPVLFFFQILEA